ncbi:phosphoribosylanthranilate isomerase [Spongiibacter sp. KMU-166]|uniref:N-(5'-phosphoribosyl)anthranilate isomerase n=1 Tax=Spongiibacter thalassae TaxID=2721624 RepID=A0ABX1GCV2_9GAMM|nr:phosphoribosylanthranilate isomerase [Spongiibacter thalassae]
MSRTRVKICGICREEDARAAVEAGADALGFVFYAKSPRAVTPEQAASIIRGIPAFVSTVGLFVNADLDFISRTAALCSLDLLQMHGDESPEFCAALPRPYLRALRMRDGLDVTRQAAAYVDARAILLDSYKPGVPGGTGESFDWARIPHQRGFPLLLAGGLHSGNVGAAVASCRPWAVDVSGGVEIAPGQKCPEKISQFIKAVADADRLES